MTTEQFIGAPLKPVAETFDAAGMSTGALAPPAIPLGTENRSSRPRAEDLCETGPCHHGSGETYVRKHWFQVLTESGETMTIYFERQVRSRSKDRWWLFTIESD